MTMITVKLQSPLAMLVAALLTAALIPQHALAADAAVQPMAEGRSCRCV
jgi:hypothetical protein